MFSFQEGEENEEVNGLYKIMTKTGSKLGKVRQIKSNPGELVHGNELLIEETKILVQDMYENSTNLDDEFITGAFLQ